MAESSTGINALDIYVSAYEMSEYVIALRPITIPRSVKKKTLATPPICVLYFDSFLNVNDTLYPNMSKFLKRFELFLDVI